MAPFDLSVKKRYVVVGEREARETLGRENSCIYVWPSLKESLHHGLRSPVNNVRYSSWKYSRRIDKAREGVRISTVILHKPCQASAIYLIVALSALSRRHRNEILFPSPFPERAFAARRFDVRRARQQPPSETFCLG